MFELDLREIVMGYGIQEPEITFIRHNENRTYRVVDAEDNTYLLRIHQPVKDSMAGLQHAFAGLMVELQMLEELASWGNLKVQEPLRNRNGELLTVIEHEGQKWNSSILTWIEGRDLQKTDVTDPVLVEKLGVNIYELHRFYRQYHHEGLDKRPSQGMDYNDYMVKVIKNGLDKELFTSSDVITIEQTIELVNKRLKDKRNKDTWGLIHGDLSLGNMIITPEEEFCFIDFGFFGPGYYLTDVAMGAMMIPSEYRDTFLKGYFGENGVNLNNLILLEGFMLMAIIGYYVFQMENESVHPWMRERMPKLCSDHCIPFLSGERIFYTV